MKSAPTLVTPESKLSQNVEISTLCAFYGRLLTERQQEALHLHYDEDWSLAEVAEHFGVSRQNVHDLITRSAQKLHHYEKAVGGVAQAKSISRRLHQALSAIQAGENAEATRQIRRIITEIDGEE